MKIDPKKEPLAIIAIIVWIIKLLWSGQ